MYILLEICGSLQTYSARLACTLWLMLAVLTPVALFLSRCRMWLRIAAAEWLNVCWHSLHKSFYFYIRVLKRFRDQGRQLPSCLNKIYNKLDKYAKMDVWSMNNYFNRLIFPLPRQLIMHAPTLKTSLYDFDCMFFILLNEFRTVYIAYATIFLTIWLVLTLDSPKCVLIGSLKWVRFKWRALAHLPAVQLPLSSLVNQ